MAVLMSHIKSHTNLIEDIYTYLQKLSKDLTPCNETRHDLTQEVIIQIMEVPEERLNQIQDQGNLEGWCATVMLRNYYSNNSGFNYHRRKHKKMVPFSIDHVDSREHTGRHGEFGFYIEYRRDKAPEPLHRDEYEEQQKIINHMRQSKDFTALDVNIMISYFGTQYNFKESHREIKEAGVNVSYGWLHERLKDIKRRIPNQFKQRWKDS